jgi:branched-chain amino acid transport system substrate-binding protein
MKNIIVILSVLLLLGACAPRPPEVVKVGGNIALSGNLALYGANEHNGIALAVKDINDAGGIAGKQFVFIAEDNQGDAKTAVTAMQKLLDTDKIDVAFTAFTHITQAVAPITQQAGIVLMYHSSIAKMARENSLVFRDYWDAAEMGKTLGAYAASQGHTKLAYIGEISDVCEEFYAAVIDGTGAPEAVVLKQTFNPGEKDFRTMLLKAKEASPQALLFCTWRSEDLVMKQLDELQLIAMPTYHAVAPFLPSAAAANEQFKKNRAVSSWYGFTLNTADPKIQQFIDKYRAAYNTEPIPDALFAYDDMIALAKAIETCQSTEAACIVNALREQPFDGVSGQLRFDADRVSQRAMLLIRHEDDGWREIKQ